MRLYQSGALLTGARHELIRRGGVLVDGPRIVAAGPLDTLMAGHPIPADVVDLGEVTLLPGLVDAHVHLGFDGGPGPVARMKAETDTQQLILMLRSARELLSAGVTTARDLGARSFLDIAVAAATASGMAEGPRLLTAARPLTLTGGHCWFMGGECDTADDLRRMVRLHHKMGADFVKVMSTGGFMTEGAPPWSAQFSPAELDTVVAEAHRLGKRVAAHAHGRLGIAQAVTAQVDTIEHCSFAGPDRRYGSDFDPAVVEQIAAAGIYVCPTMNVHALALRERFGDALEKVIMGLYSGGVQIIAGTDAGVDNCPHDAYIAGLEALAMVGLPAVEILDAATLRAARALGVDDRTGTIEPGKDADLIAVRGDPRTDISVLNHLDLVVARGAEYRPAPHRARRPAGPPPVTLTRDRRPPSRDRQHRGTGERAGSTGRAKPPMTALAAAFNDITVADLRRRGGLKWTYAGPDVLGAFVAEMDFGTAPVVEDALRGVITRRDYGYLTPLAARQMAEACAAWLAGRTGWAADPDWIRPLPDVIKGLEAAISLFSRPDSPVILPTPAYMPFLSVPPLLGRKIIQVPMITVDGRAVLDLDGLDAAFRAGGHLLILCSPCNPMGRVYAQAELAAVSEVVERHGGRVFADEIHAPLVYPGRQHIPYASLSEAAAGHTLTATSASKGWNLPGLKCAQLILTNEADRELWAEAGRLIEHGASTPGVHANIAAFTAGQDWLAEVLDYLDQGRMLLGDLLAEHLPGVRYQPPEGTYLAWLDCRELGLGDNPGEFFLDKASVLVNDGPAFGEAGKGHVRLNFATPWPILQAIVRQMARPRPATDQEQSG